MFDADCFTILKTLVKWTSIVDYYGPMVNQENLEKKSLNPESEHSHSDKAAEKPAGPSIERKSWADLNHNLKQALHTWEVLNEQMEDKVSPEETQLHEVKRLLRELKDKLKQFSD